MDAPLLVLRGKTEREAKPDAILEEQIINFKNGESAKKNKTPPEHKITFCSSNENTKIIHILSEIRLKEIIFIQLLGAGTWRINEYTAE